MFYNAEVFYFIAFFCASMSFGLGFHPFFLLLKNECPRTTTQTDSLVLALLVVQHLHYNPSVFHLHAVLAASA